ncbi:N-acetyl-gamma-glutamyl-phosphate reductase [Methanolobus halotolerans]|uniref:N-acetyl-gamma-glutamyl-phosphate reductase n=1 Tax=Methanolobus halotolerans TaxID=2052935 RepID=A0A4E0PY42_9EURY|nr:N-acetyl-gamma-glutamyl-phosphate reductase [Methanolobus halotolerans]TGC08446.1 N-acetyl-gamma-glutamyl-phosphate reductase [Methanolobus halotolerans]
MINAGIIGASGYTGGELMRLFLNHPEVNIVAATSRKLAGKPVSGTHRHLKGFLDLKFQDLGPGEARESCDVAFLAVPHGAAMDIVPELLGGDLKVIDLSADYRLKPDAFKEAYGFEHRDPRDAVYGLVELHPEVAEQSFIANPGCYPTGASLAAAPLAKAGMISSVIFDSKSGVTGAGIAPTETSHYPNMAENVQAYKLTTHRHVAEFTQELNRLDNSLTNISFTPHVVPAIRGILTTAHVFTKDKMSTDDVRTLYEDMYRNKPFVRVLDGLPSLGSVRGSNFCDIGFEADKRNNRVVVVSAIDNLVKGASGQAIQNMNLMFGLDEKLGLWNAAAAP